MFRTRNEDNLKEVDMDLIKIKFALKNTTD
jgi:hypothetical protein